MLKALGRRDDVKVLNYLLQLEEGSKSHNLKRYEMFNMICPKGVEEIFEVVKIGMQVNNPPDTFAIAVSLLPTFLIDYLIKTGADVNSSFRDGESALHAAVRVNSLSKFKHMIKHNVSLNIEWRGITPIETSIVHYPSGNIKRDVMKCLSDTSLANLHKIVRWVNIYFHNYCHDLSIIKYILYIKFMN